MGRLRLPLVLEGTTLGVLSSELLCNGGDMTGRVVVGATQPDVEAVPGLAASCLNTSRLTGSAGRLSKGRASKRPDLQYTWCGVLVLWEIVSKDNNYHLISYPQSYS